MPSKKTKKKAKRKKKLRKKSKKKGASEEAQREELQANIIELCTLANRKDAIEELMDIRKKRIENSMASLGLSKLVVDGVGTANVSERRTFKVIDEDALIELMTPRQMASLVRVTADVYDAAVAENVKIDEAVSVGRTPTTSVSRSRKKLARERQKKYIAEARRAAEERITEHRSQWRESRGA